MNAFVADKYAESIQRLALGIEPIDAARRLRIAQPIEIAVEGTALPSPLPPALGRFLTVLRERGGRWSDTMARARRHPSCRHVLLFERGLKDHFDLRLFDHAQRFVPRRLHVPLVPLADPSDPTLLDAVPLASRSRFPALFPGANYDVSDNATGLRGRVVRDDPVHPGSVMPVRWARIEARRNGVIVGRAHGDHRGEFLLLLESSAVPAADLPTPFTLAVTAFAPPAPLPPPAPPVADVDPLWDLPLETAAAPGISPDPVAAGETVPPSYTGTSGLQPVTFTFGVLISRGVAPFKIL